MTSESIKNQNNQTNSNHIGFVLYDSNFILKVNQTKPIRILFYVADQTTFRLKNEPNYITNIYNTTI